MSHRREPGTDPNYELRQRIRAGHKRRRMKSVRKAWECKTLEDLNAILWPSGKPRARTP